jgi:hypothetical protein
MRAIACSRLLGCGAVLLGEWFLKVIPEDIELQRHRWEKLRSRESARLQETKAKKLALLFVAIITLCSVLYFAALSGSSRCRARVGLQIVSVLLVRTAVLCIRSIHYCFCSHW